jgi:hypothetical protein
VTTKDWLTVTVAALSIVSTATTAVLAMILNRRSQRDREEFEGRRANASFEQAHLDRLWDHRQEGYLKLATRALELREAASLARDSQASGRVDSLALDTLAELSLYADWQVYKSGEFMRGSYEGLMDGFELLAESEQLTPEHRQQLLDDVDERARQLVFEIRQHAQQLPEWREPISLRAEGTGESAPP